MPSLAMDGGAGAVQAAGGMNYLPGFVPPFRSGARDRWTFGGGGRWMPDARVQLAGGFEGIADRTAEGTAIGAGDVRLGASADLVELGIFRVWTGFSVKLPDAKDENELGTDETDVAFGSSLEVASGPWRALGGAGLGIWGNPLRFANQDDVPMVRLAGSWTRPRAGGLGLQVGAALNVDVATARNPARSVIGGWVRVLRPLGRASVYVECSAGAGLTPAAPDGFAGASLGVSLPQRADGSASSDAQAQVPPFPEPAR